MKQCKDLKVVAVEYPSDGYVLLKLTDDKPFTDIRGGQFVEIKVEGSPKTFLRRPISVNYVDLEKNELHLLIQLVGDGTRALSELKVGDSLNVLFPLGNGFTQGTAGEKVLLVGGGVGIAPLLEYGRQLVEAKAVPVFLLGGRSSKNLIMLDQYKSIGEVYVTTEDGSMGNKGFVTDSDVLKESSAVKFDRISVCGPKPMMVAMAKFAKQRGIKCEVSLENMMACGLGACLCCVEKTVRGNVCVCKEGPVFDVNDLNW